MFSLRNELSLNRQFLNLFKQVLKPKWPQTTTLTFLEDYILTSPTYWDPEKIQLFGTHFEKFCTRVMMINIKMENYRTNV